MIFYCALNGKCSALYTNIVHVLFHLSKHVSYLNAPWSQDVRISGLPTVHAATSFSCGFLPRSWKHIPILQWQRSMALSTSWDYLVCSSPHTQCIVLVMIESFTTNNWSLYRYEQLVDHSIECPVRHWGMDVCIRTWFLMFVILTVLVPHDYHVKTWKFNLCMGDLYCTLIISKVP